MQGGKKRVSHFNIQELTPIPRVRISVCVCVYKDKVDKNSTRWKEVQGHIYREKQTDGSDRQGNGGSGGVMRADRKCKMRGELNGKRRG